VTSKQLIRVVRSICTGSSVCCNTAEWYHNHLPDGEAYQTICRLWVAPAPGGSAGTSFEGADWEACARQFADRVATLLSNGIDEPQADVTMMTPSGGGGSSQSQCVGVPECDGTKCGTAASGVGCECHLQQ